MRPSLVALALMAMAAPAAAQQQQADHAVDLSVAAPAYAHGRGPRLVIDGAHNNFHTVDGRYGPFAELMRNDGFRVSGSDAKFTDRSLRNIDVLVIANAVADEDREEWVAPNPSAFTAEEIAAVRRYVRRGGSLLLIADHMPFGGAAQEMGRAFGVEFQNGFADDGDDEPDLFTRDNGGLTDDPLLAGIRQVRSFMGSAFAAPSARALMRLGPRYTVLHPQVAWEFDDNTPRVSGDGLLQGALMQVGRGRVAVFGEAAMFTSQITPAGIAVGLGAPGAEDNKVFALAVMHWLARRPARSR